MLNLEYVVMAMLFALFIATLLLDSIVASIVILILMAIVGSMITVQLQQTKRGPVATKKRRFKCTECQTVHFPELPYNIFSTVCPKCGGLSIRPIRTEERYRR